MKNIFFFVIIYCALFNLSFSQTYWERTNGPYFIAGNILELVYGMDGCIYATLNNGGLYQSKDNGENWLRIDKDFDNSVNSIAVNEQGHIYACTNSSLYISKDNGLKWDVNYTDAQKVAINKFGHIFVADRQRLYRSTDEGKNFKILMNINEGYSVIFLDFDVYGNIYFAQNTYNIYKSTDNGDHFSLINFEMTPIGLIQDICVDNKNRLYVYIPNKLLYSPDDGNTWKVIKDSTKWCKDIAVDSIGNVYAAFEPNTILISTNQGEIWETFNKNSNFNSSINKLLVKNNNEIFAGMSGSGIYRTTNKGETWLESGRNLLIIPPQYMCAGNDGSVFAATRYFTYGGLFSTSDAGNNWTNLNFSQYATELKSNINGDILIVTGNTLLKSTDTGHTWLNIGSGGRDVYNFALDRSGIIYRTFCTNSINEQCLARSTDYGNSWETVYNGGAYPPRIYVYTDYFNNVYLAEMVYGMPHGSPGFYVGSISRFINGFETKRATNLRMTDLPTGWCYTGNGNLYVSTTEDGVYKSTDRGANWSKVNKGLKSLKVNDIIATRNDSLHAATEDGVYLSIDYGENWDNISGDIGNQPVYALTINSDGYLFASADVVYRTTVPKGMIIMDVNDEINNDITSSLYPNPVNSNCKIKFLLHSSSLIDIDVMDILGRHIEKIINNKLYDIGENIIDFNTDKINPGIYFCIIKSQNSIQRVKFTVLK